MLQNKSICLGYIFLLFFRAHTAKGKYSWKVTLPVAEKSLSPMMHDSLTNTS
jgi:hypothetical protein